MDKLNIITDPVKNELDVFQTQFKKALSGHSPDYQYMIDYIAGTNGKHIRPILLLLSAKLCGEINQRTIDYTVILELLHTSTLIHDDVVDNTLERRGQQSVNAKYDNKTAVLLGDYVLSQAILHGVSTRNMTVLDLLSQLAQNLVEGELSQLVTAKSPAIDEGRYFEIIYKKTALLLSSCTEMGAISVDADAEVVDLLRHIGVNIGLMFQMKDDTFDYFDQGDIGKPTGNDIREGKITLPLIHALKVAPEAVRKPYEEMIDNWDFTQDNILKLTSFAKEYGGIEYTYSKMNELRDKTLVLLAYFPESEVKTAFIELIDYIIERNK
jgi:Geranylgeranyl pyrophosphate synthase